MWHWLDGEGVSGRRRLHGEIDWQRRYALMRTHTAMHILCGVVWRDYGAQVTGGNMEPGKGRMDFEFANLQKELVSEIEAQLQRRSRTQLATFGWRSCLERRPSKSPT